VRDPTAVMPGAMSASTALCFYLLGCALVLLSAGRSLLCLNVSLLVTVATTATLVAGGYALLDPRAVPAFLTMPAMTALILLILSLGVVSSNTHDTLMTVMTSNSAGGTMARRLLPASILIPLALGFLRLKGQEAGWFDPAIGLVLHVVATMLLLALFIWWNATALDRIAGENGRIEHAVQDTQSALLEILGHVNNAAFAHDLKGNLTFFNGAAERMFGIPAAEALQKNIYSVITPQSAETARSILSSRLIGGVGRPEPLVLRTSSGEQDCEVLTVMMCDHKGNPAGFFSLVSPLFTGPAPETPSSDRVLEPVSVV
jgi:PAS domain S-box-containing protein